jgi:hypothetical protein
VPPGWSELAHATVDYSTYKMWGYTMNDNGACTLRHRSDEDAATLTRTDAAGDRGGQDRRRRPRGHGPLFLSLNFLAPHHEANSIQRERTGWCARRRATAAPSRALRSRAPCELQRGGHVDKPRFLRATPTR